MELRGIDVSYWQGLINWEEVKASHMVDFVIIRAGAANKLDKRFKLNVAGCARNGIPYGLYWASYATTPTEAVKEAELLYPYARMCKPDYPLYIDFEEFSLSNLRMARPKLTKAHYGEIIRDIITAWGERIEKLGGYAAFYGNKSFTYNYIGEAMKKRFDYWLAYWSDSAPAYPNRMIQYTNKLRIPGIPTNVDGDICKYDYPALIRGRFNGT